jgi:hypothetical protein
LKKPDFAHSCEPFWDFQFAWLNCKNSPPRRIRQFAILDARLNTNLFPKWLNVVRKTGFLKALKCYQISETRICEGDMMDQKRKERFIEEVDQELRSIDARLRKVLSEADALLREHSKGTEETQDTHEEETEEA